MDLLRGDVAFIQLVHPLNQSRQRLLSRKCPPPSQKVEDAGCFQLAHRLLLQCKRRSEVTHAQPRRKQYLKLSDQHELQPGMIILAMHDVFRSLSVHELTLRIILVLHLHREEAKDMRASRLQSQ